jgi:RNA polymerase sigma-70 factor (ECF subfamily)
LYNVRNLNLIISFSELPMTDSAAVQDMLQRWRQGDPLAEQQLFARYCEALSRLADQHLSRKLAARVDGEDVVQSVFRTFFRRGMAGEFHIDSSGELWGLLVRITVRKARAYARHHLAQKRDASAEAPALAEAGFPDRLAREPDPAEAAALVDQIEALLRGLPESYAHILQHRLQGQLVDETARELSVSRQTVYRALTLLQQRLTRSEAAPAR